MVTTNVMRRVRARQERQAALDLGPEVSRKSVPWRRWAAELAIIFLGVFLAALADNWRERRGEQQTAERLAVALKSSFADMRRFNQQNNLRYQREVAAYEAALARGERPRFPVDMRPRFSQRPPLEIWEAFLAAEGAKLFPPDVVFDLARFYGGFENYSDRVTLHYRWIENVALMQDDPGAPYLPGSSRLRPEWRERLERSKETSLQLQRLAERTGDLERRIFASLD